MGASTNNYDVLSIGHALTDLQFFVQEDFLKLNHIKKGCTTNVSHQQQEDLLTKLQQQYDCHYAFGGSAANSMVALQALGGSTFLHCNVANDDSGKRFLAELDNSKVAHNFKDMNLSAGYTGRCLVMVTPNGERSMCTCLGVSSQISFSNALLTNIKNSKTLYIESYALQDATSLSAIKQAITFANTNNIPCVLSLSDPSLVERCATDLRELLTSCKIDFLICNIAEALLFTKSKTLEAAAIALKSYVTKFCITRGGQGCDLFDGDNLHKVNGLAAKVIDTTGAGDMFTGALLYAITHELSFIQAIEFANRVAAISVTHPGPRLSHKLLQEIKKPCMSGENFYHYLQNETSKL